MSYFGKLRTIRRLLFLIAGALLNYPIPSTTVREMGSASKLMDFEVSRCTRHCAETERQFEPGETFYSILSVEGAQVVRYDYCAEAWQGSPEGVLGWWKSQMPERNSNKQNWAPNDVMLHLFEELGEKPHLGDMRYVLTLLLVRRRVMRLEESEVDAQGKEQLVVYCPKREETYRVSVITPDEQRQQEIQEELEKLLFASSMD